MTVIFSAIFSLCWWQLDSNPQTLNQYLKAPPIMLCCWPWTKHEIVRHKFHLKLNFKTCWRFYCFFISFWPFVEKLRVRYSARMILLIVKLILFTQACKWKWTLFRVSMGEIGEQRQLINTEQLRVDWDLVFYEMRWILKFSVKHCLMNEIKFFHILLKWAWTILEQCLYIISCIISFEAVLTLMVMLSVALFLEVALALFLGPWFRILRAGAGGWIVATGAGIGGADGAGGMTVVMFEVRQQHLHRR